MKTKLLKKSKNFILFLALISLNAFTAKAQTITPATAIPSSTEVGTSPTLNFNYTSPEACKIRVDLWIVNVDENGVLTNPYDAYQAGQASASLPAAASETQQAVTIAVPGGLTFSSNLPAGKTYAWDYKLLRDSDGGYLTGTQVATTIIASSSVVDGLALDNPPTIITAGSTITITVNYTIPSARLIKFGISKYSSSGSFINDLVGAGVDNLPATTTTPVSLSQDFVIPADAVTSADLTNGEYYKVDTAIFTPGFASYILGKSSNVTLNPALSTTGFAKNSIKLYPNPVSNKLYFDQNLEFNAISVFDVIGKKIMEFKKSDITNSIDVSQLNKGMYLLVTDTNQKSKFIKN